jgi:hypothetical protein
MEGDKYKGRISIVYLDSLALWRIAIAELQGKMAGLMKRKSMRDIWIMVDTVTNMQTQLLTEARSIEINRQGTSRKQSRKPEDQYYRDATCQVDYNINLTQMAELTNSLLKLPANILMIAHEKETQDNNQRKLYIPAMSGQSREKVIGDADIVARMVVESDDSRVFLLRPGKGFDAGDRTGRLDPSEPADLAVIQNKIFGSTNQPETQEGT